MTRRGRPARIFSEAELKDLLARINRLPFLTRAQDKARAYITMRNGDFSLMDDTEKRILKEAFRQLRDYERNLDLLGELKWRRSNDERMTALENEILELYINDTSQDRDAFFSLHLALASYARLSNAQKAEKLRADDEKRRALVRTTQKQESEAQKRRRVLSRLKYELGGAVLSARQKLGFEQTTADDVLELFRQLEILQKEAKASGHLMQQLRQSELYRAVAEYFDAERADEKMIEALERLSRYKASGGRGIFQHLIEQW